MIEIAADTRPPLATLLLIALPLIFIAAVLLRGQPPAVRRVVLAATAISALVVTAASATLWSRRHAGTGLETARGWPKPIYSMWEDTEARQRISGVRWRGVAENAFLYGAIGLFVCAVGARWSTRRAEG